MTEVHVRGACPSLPAPMETGDGLLVRLIVNAPIPLDAFIGLCDAARMHGNGTMEVSARGSLQVRGLTPLSAPLFAAALATLDVEINDGVPILADPLPDDPASLIDANRLAAQLRADVASAALGGDEKSRKRHVDRGKLLPRDRVERLLDPGSPFLEIGQLAAFDLYHHGVPGAGMIAGDPDGFLPNLGPLADKIEVVAIADVVFNRATEMAESFCIPKAYSSLTDLLDDPAVEAVANLTPIGVHAQTSLRILRSGRHLISEKPLATSVDDANPPGACGISSARP